MGTYLPSKPKRDRERSLHDTLNEAEHDHFLDCPNADRWLRAGAQLLDVILCFLILSGIHHVSETMRALTPNWPNINPRNIAYWNSTIFYSASALKLFTVYTYFVWTVAIFGGTPAKLLLGMRVLDAKTGQKLTVPRILFRELVGKAMVLGGGFFLTLNRRKLVHDKLCNTVVKKVHGGP